jgi:hypothetical protein
MHGILIYIINIVLDFWGPDSGWGRSFSDLIGSLASTTAELFHLKLPIGEYLLLGAIIVSIGLFAMAAIEDSDHREQWLFCALLVAAAVFVHYLVAALATSGFYYMKPTLIVAWMCGIILCRYLNSIRFPTLGLILISVAIIFVVMVRVVAPQYAFFAKSFPEALEYAGAVQLAGVEGPIYTESHFFFVRSHIPMIDMGDTCISSRENWLLWSSFFQEVSRKLKSSDSHAANLYRS